MGRQVSRLPLQIPLWLFYFGRRVGDRHWSRTAYPHAAPYMACRTVRTGEFGSSRCHTGTEAEAGPTSCACSNRYQLASSLPV